MLTGAGRRIVAVSTKLYFDTATSLQYCDAVATGLSARGHDESGPVAVGVLPSFLSIPAVAPRLIGAGAFVGAQDLCQEDRGAFTGEVSGTDLTAAGCSVVEVGHAERRTIYRESDELVTAKVDAALRNELIPLLCIGEAERTSPESAAAICRDQVMAATRGGGAFEIWLAYEPYWAIGAPAPAPVDYVRAVCAELRGALSEVLPTASILYGGSAGPGLLAKLHPSVDGLFLGRFAHDPNALLAVVDEAAALER